MLPDDRRFTDYMFCVTHLCSIRTNEVNIRKALQRE